MKEIFKNQIKKHRFGFVMLFAIILSSIIFAVALGVLNVSYKELKFSTSAKNTNEAFYAADTGAECALYYDLVPLFGSYGDLIDVFPMNPPGETPNTYCSFVQVDLNNPAPGGNSSVGPWQFKLFNLGQNNSQGCAIVTVTKDTSVNPTVTTIVSKGYNTGGRDNPECTSNNPNRVEREIKITY